MIEVADVLGLTVGQEFAVSDWIEVTQSRIDAFADATDDRQWIHVDPARAAAESPHGATIAHGFLTLALIPAMLRTAVRVRDVRMAVNYGLNRVRFVSPVPAGARIRGRFAPQGVTRHAEAADVAWAVTIEREGSDKPCCVAEWIARYYFRT
jgi:acyl dehydratase